MSSYEHERMCRRDWRAFRLDERSEADHAAIARVEGLAEFAHFDKEVDG